MTGGSWRIGTPCKEITGCLDQDAAVAQHFRGKGIGICQRNSFYSQRTPGRCARFESCPIRCYYNVTWGRGSPGRSCSAGPFCQQRKGHRSASSGCFGSVVVRYSIPIFCSTSDVSQESSSVLVSSLSSDRSFPRASQYFESETQVSFIVWFYRITQLKSPAALFEDAFATLQGLLSTIATFWGSSEVNQVAFLYVDQASGTSKASTSLTSLAKSLAKRISPKVLLPTLLDMWQQLAQSRKLVSSSKQPYACFLFLTITRTRFLRISTSSLVHCIMPTVPLFSNICGQHSRFSSKLWTSSYTRRPASSCWASPSAQMKGFPCGTLSRRSTPTSTKMRCQRTSA